MSTRIPFLDEVWNVVTGCGDEMVSPGCLNCYARRMSGRNLPHLTNGHGFEPIFHADRLEKPLRWRKPRVIGVTLMGDLFHDGITWDQRWEVYDLMDWCSQHTFVNLTKRTKARLDFLNANEDTDDGWPLPNLIEMSTVCNQEEADRVIPLLLDTPAAVRGVSYEPALGPVDFVPYMGGVFCDGCGQELGESYAGRPHECDWRDGDRFPELCGYGVQRPGLDLVIAGPETGPGARPGDPAWLASAHDQCVAAGVAHYDRRESHKHWREWPGEAPCD